MTILQQPDRLSLSGNIKDFRISASDKISFILQLGDNEVLAQSYEPGQDGIITISLKDIIHSWLSFELRETSLVYQQTNIVQSFTAIIDGKEVTFRVLRAGVDRLADTATNFLTHNFLTWQPTVKPVTYYSPEFLTYYATIDCVAKLCAYFTDESGTVIAQKDIALANLDAGKAYTIPLQYASVVGKLNNELPGYYDVWIENSEGNRLTYVQRYYASDMLSEQEQWILFENSIGGVDTFRAYGSCDFIGEHTHNIAEIEDNFLEYRVDTERKFQKSTGHLNDQERRWLLDFFPSLAKYIYTGSYLRSIVVIDSNVTYTDRDLPSNYTFTYKYADARPFLNIPRANPSGDLNITVPDVGSFTVPPRLAEFPRLPLTEGVFFPVQDPYSEKWCTTTAGSLSDFIAERLVHDYGGSGGIGHQHNNIDLLQLLSFAEEYLLVSGRKIKSGYADETYTFSKNTSRELITFIKGLISESIITAEDGIQLGKSFAGGITGHGGLFTSSGHGELRSLRVNEWFETSEFRYNYVDVTTGEKWSAPGGGIVESVVMDTDPEGNELNTGVVTLKLEAGQIGAVAFDDLAMGMYHFESGNATEDYDDGKGNRRFSGFTTVFFRITEIIESGLNSKFRFELRSSSDNYLNPVPPTAMMHFVCFGNVSNKSRQSSMYQTRTYTRYLKNVDWWEFSFGNIAMQFGDLSNLSVFGADMTGYSAYVDSLYFTGKIEQLEKIVEDTLGDGDLRMELKRTGMEMIVNGHIDTVISAKILRYFKNITSEVIKWVWTRESGTEQVDIASDADWNDRNSHINTNEIHIVDGDIPETSQSVKFICEATLGSIKLRNELTF